MSIWESYRINGETGRREVYGSSDSVDTAQKKVQEARQDGRDARPGNSDSHGESQR